MTSRVTLTVSINSRVNTVTRAEPLECVYIKKNVFFLFIENFYRGELVL